MILVWDISMPLNKHLIFFTVLSAIVYAQDCFDREITANDFPLLHDVVNFYGFETNRIWDLTNIPIAPEDVTADGPDYTYKLLLTDSADVFFTTCDDSTFLDVQIAIFDSCDINSAILYNDDAFGDEQYTTWYNVDSTDNRSYDFGCTSGISGSEGFANMIPKWSFGPGDYYIVVSSRTTCEDNNNCFIASSFGFALVVDSLTTSDDYSEINYHFSEGVYGGDYIDVYNQLGIELDINDYQISMPVQGGATNATIETISNMDSQPLTGGEGVIKLSITYEGNPTGDEQIMIGPVNESSIFNSVGIPLLDLTGITILLTDALAPSIENISPLNGQTQVDLDANVYIEFSEKVKNLSGQNIDDTNAQNSIIMKDLGNNLILDYTISTNDNINFILNPAEEFQEFSFIELTITGIKDSVGNQMIDVIHVFQSIDDTQPMIQSAGIASSNHYVFIEFNEPVFSSNSGSGAIELEDLDTLWSPDICEEIEVVGIYNSSGGALQGGESTINIFLELTGSPSGNETIEFMPSSGSSIFDNAGNPLDANSTTSIINLRQSAQLEIGALDEENNFVDINFIDSDELPSGVFGNYNLNQGLSFSDLSLTFYSNEGNANIANISSLSNIANQPLTGGESTIRVYLDFNLPCSGVEMVKISPTSDQSIYNSDGVHIPKRSYTQVIKLNDIIAPDIYIADPNLNNSVNVDQNKIFTIEISEELSIPNDTNIDQYLKNFMTLCINECSDFLDFSIDINGYNETPRNIKIIPDNPYPSEKLIQFYFEGTVGDTNNNLSSINFDISFMINDYIPPNTDNSTLDGDNTFITIFFDDWIYGNEDGTLPIGLDDVECIVTQNNESASDSCFINAIYDINGNQLVGGEMEIRLHIDYNWNPIGGEIIQIVLPDGATIYDESGNQFEQSILVEVSLFDILPPSIIDLTYDIDDYLMLRENNTQMSFTLSEPASDVSIQTYTGTLGEIQHEITFNPPDDQIELRFLQYLPSFDSIIVNFSDLVDTAAIPNINTDITFIYYTPIPGDLNLDGDISYLDVQLLLDSIIFNQPSKFDLGPAIGDIPHIIYNGNDSFDIGDGVIFTQAWSWYQKNYGQIIEDVTTLGQLLQSEYINDTLYILLDENVFSGRIKLLYDIKEGLPIEFLKRDKRKNELFLMEHHPQMGFSIIDFAKIRCEEPDTLKIKLKKKTDLEIYYLFKDKNKHTIQEGVQNLAINNLPHDLSLLPAYPNPFNPSTTIRFNIPETSVKKNVTLSIYDIQGKRVETFSNNILKAGYNHYIWNATGFSSGLYFARLTYGSTSLTQKILLLK